MAQNFWIAIFAWTTCFVVTIVVSLMTKPKPESELADSSTASRLTRMNGESGTSALVCSRSS